MDIALMQPYLFPYLGYFQLLAATDRFVVFDNVQYLRRGWMHRNRVLAPDGSSRFVGLATVKAPRTTAIADIEVRGDVDHGARFRDALAPYRDVAPHAEVVVDLVSRWARSSSGRLVDVVQHALRLTCDLLGLEADLVRASDLGLRRDPGTDVSGWAIAACSALGAEGYVNLPGGRSLYPAEPFARAGLGLAFVEPSMPPYPRGQHPFEPALSILDVLAFAGVQGTAAMIGDPALAVVVAPDAGRRPGRGPAHR